MVSNKRRGDLLEDVVALLHQTPDVIVQRRVRLPGSSGRSKREIDVLLTTIVAGYEVRIAIECKNEKKKVGSPKIDGFVGKLADVGIPVSHGIYVSAVGYTSSAVDRARSAGVRMLQLEGLTADRLAAEVYGALQSVTYVLLTWTTLNRFENVAEMAAPEVCEAEIELDVERHRTGTPGLLNAIWDLWIGSKISDQLGKKHVFIRLPDPFDFGPGFPEFRNGAVVATLEVSGHVASIAGSAKRLGLRNVETSELEKLHLEANYTEGPGTVRLSSFASEADLASFLFSGALHIHRGRVRVPRMASETTYWPPTQEALDRVRELREAGEDVTFARVEGTDLSQAWKGFTNDDGEV
jgi:hypothetical protein